MTQSNCKKRWYHEPMMWLVVGGPAAVVVAGIATVFIATSGSDVDVRTGQTLTSQPVNATNQDASQLPAMAVRNHAQSPEDAVKVEKAKAEEAQKGQ